MTYSAASRAAHLAPQGKRGHLPHLIRSACRQLSPSASLCLGPWVSLAIVPKLQLTDEQDCRDRRKDLLGTKDSPISYSPAHWTITMDPVLQKHPAQTAQGSPRRGTQHKLQQITKYLYKIRGPRKWTRPVHSGCAVAAMSLLSTYWVPGILHTWFIASQYPCKAETMIPIL